MEQSTKQRFRGTYLLYVWTGGDLASYRGAIPVQLPLQDPHAGRPEEEGGERVPGGRILLLHGTYASYF